MEIDEIRNEALTEDAKMEMIADHIGKGIGNIEIVEIHGMTGTLSDDDFKKIMSNNCMILASTQYFYKQYSAATVVRYGALPRLGVDKVIFDYISIDKATKTFELKNEIYSSGE